MEIEMMHDQPPPTGVDPQRPSPELLLWAYQQGVFPMADPGTGVIDWYRPRHRGILPLDASFHVPSSLRRVVRAQPFNIRCDTAFEQVMRSCAKPRSIENQSWISDRLIEAYSKLHTLGRAHSIEAWRDDALVGGLYGVHIGSAFFGESMFTDAKRGGTNASKVCLVHLVNWLRHRGFKLLDTQFWNPHLEQFGCREIAADDYEVLLIQAMENDVKWGRFQAL